MKDSSTKIVRRHVKSKSWPVRLKSSVNLFCYKLFSKRPFKLGMYDTFGAPPKWQRNFTRRWRVFARETNLPVTLGILAFCLAVLFVWHAFAPDFSSDIRVEFVGLIFDVVFILVIFAFFEQRRQKVQDIRRQQEIIEDFKKWDSDEARFRIAGAVRRLNMMGRADIDFRGVELRDFSFRGQDIRNISGSTFYDGTWGEAGSRDQVTLKNVDFSWINCAKVVFSKFNPFSSLAIDVKFASIIDCSFVCSNLEGAIFDGAHLEWTTVHPVELGTWEESSDEPPVFHQTHYPPFHEANLTSVSFVDTRFKNADFREAEGVLQCDFTGATGLDSCLFDDDATRQAALAMAQKGGSSRKGS